MIMNEMGLSESENNFHSARLYLTGLSRAIEEVEGPGNFVDLTRPTVYDKNQYALIKGLVDNLGRYKKSLTSDLVEEAEGLLIIAKIYLAAFENNPKIMEGHYSIALAPKKEKKRQETKSVKIEESSLQRQTAIESIRSALTYGVDSFKTKRDELVKAGVMTRDEINSLLYVKSGAIEFIKSSLAYGPESFSTKRNEWVGAGVVIMEEINNLPYVKNSAIEFIKSALAYGVESFETTRNKWIEVGVVTREEINNLPYVKQSAQNSLRSAFNYGMDSFNTRKNEWIKAGVINEADAEIIRKSYGKK